MEYKIPLFDLNMGVEEENAVINTLRSNWISMGPECQSLEEEFAAACGTKYAVSLSNCTVALHLALVAAGCKPGDEVIVPSLTFAATANSVTYAGAQPVFADIESFDSPVVSARTIEAVITPKTTGIIVMHYAGFPVDVDAVKVLAEKHKLFVIEDACHAPLSEYKGKKIGGLADAGCFSFFSNKNISSGEGGMLTTDSEAIYNQCKLLRSHGMTTMSYERSKGHATSYDIQSIGYNYRLDDIRASIARVQLGKLPADLERRSKVRSWYLKELAGVTDVLIPFEDHKGFVSNYIFPIALRTGDVGRREKVRNFIHAKGVQTSNHYPAVHKFSAYAKTSGSLPVTDAFSDTEITLPMYGSLSHEDVVEVCDAVKEAIKSVTV